MPLSPPLVPASVYAFEDSETFARASHVKVGEGYVYARWANPTVDAFEAAVADLEGTEDAEAFASGMAAIAAVFLGLCASGDRVVAAGGLYGNTHSLLTQRLPRYGIDADLLPLAAYDDISDALRGARLLYCETIANPSVRVADLDRIGELAVARGVPLVVDNTFASPLLCRPREHGASVVVHSATKFLGGHHDLLGGIVCAPGDVIESMQLLGRDLGASMSPFTAWLALRGLSTLDVRVERSCANALALACALRERDDVERVFYPALDDDPHHGLAERILGGRGGGTLAFEVAGGRERAARFQDALRVVTPAASLGGTHSLLVHPASVTHTQLSSEELASAGISEGFCRLSVGLEDAGDLAADIAAALDATGPRERGG
jgi:cystathionine beta-lyase/cystathionine gamma-synthase